MEVINIAKDFTTTPGARYYSDGPKSGEEFFVEKLKNSFQTALDKDVRLKIEMDGTEGYASSFINETFRRLGEEFGSEEAWNRLIIVSNEVPKYIIKVKNSIYEAKK